MLGDHVVGFAGMDLGHAQDRGVERADIARDDRLQRDRDVAGGDDRVDPGFGTRAMRPPAGDRDVEIGAARHHRPGADLEICRPPAPAGCACQRSRRTGNGRTGRPQPLPHHRRAPLRPAGRSDARCRRNRASRRDSGRRRAASSCARHDRRHASGLDAATGRGGWSPPRSAGNPCRRAAQSNAASCRRAAGRRPRSCRCRGTPCNRIRRAFARRNRRCAAPQSRARDGRGYRAAMPSARREIPRSGRSPPCLALLPFAPSVAESGLSCNPAARL